MIARCIDLVCQLLELRHWFALVLLAPALTIAGTLTKQDIEKRFGPPLHVQEKLSNPPAWPLTSELEPEGGPVAYAFESIDLAPIPGFEGTPMNFLVSIDRKGNFLDVELLHHPATHPVQTWRW